MGIGGAMAKKKTGPKPSPGGPRDALITIKCYSAYKDWLSAYAMDKRVTPSQLIDHALLKLAELEGWEKPPQR